MPLLPATDPMIDQAALDGAVFAFALSGGKDCGAATALAMAHLDQLGHPRALRIAIHADLGRAEWAHNEDQVKAQAHALGLDLIIVRAAAGDLPARFLNRWQRGLAAYTDLRLYNLRGPWSSPSLKFCQSEKKIQVMGPELARRFKGQTIVQVTGLRRDESRARASTPIAKVDARFAKPGNRNGTIMLMWNPAALLNRDAVFAINRQFGVPLSLVYDLGCSRHSCAACVMGSKADLEIAGAYPSNAPLFTSYIGMEIDSTFSFQSGGWLAERASHLLTPLTRMAFSAAKDMAARRREIEAQLPARHRFVNGWPLFVPDYAEAQIIAAGRAEILGQHNQPNHYDTAAKVVDRFAFLVDESQRIAA